MELRYGETPWDNMTREELLLRVLKLYKAAESARSCLRIAQHHDPKSPYWGSDGSGGSALNMLEQAMGDGLALDDENSEKLWKGFFRNALPLLFTGTNWDWNVCEKCEHWIGKSSDGTIRETCITCNGKLRPIKWTDFSKTNFENVN